MAFVVGEDANGRPITEAEWNRRQAAAKKQKADAAKRAAAAPRRNTSRTGTRTPLPTSGGGGGGTSFGSFNAEQTRNARTIISVGRQMGMSNRDIQIALMTAMQESGLRTGAAVYKKDHDSVGLFQQRPSQGWGTEAQTNDPVYASRRFFSVLKGVKNRNGMALTRAAQAVQRSAYPDAYAKHASGAASLLQKFGGISKSEANKFISQAGGGGSISGGGGTTSNTTVVNRGSNIGVEDVWSKADFTAAIAAAGFGGALIRDNAELKSLFAKAIREQWTPDRFSGEIRGTKWYRTRSDSQREYDTKRLNDPKTWAADLHDAEQGIVSIANTMGIALKGARLTALAKTAYRNGMTEAELSRLVAAEFDFDPKKAYKGDAGQAITQVRQLAASYGLTPGDENLGNTVEQMLRGDQSIEGLRQTYVESAKKRYSHFAKELDAGQTLADIAQPYRDTIGRVLEIDPASVNLTDGLLQKGLSYKDEKTKTATAMPIWQYEQTLKDDPRWLHTSNARDSMLETGRSLLSSFGLAV